MPQRGPERPYAQRLIVQLEKASRANKAPIWNEAARRLKAPARKRAEVNLFGLNRFTKSGQTILVPGKLLSRGALEHPLTIASFSASTAARRKVEASGGKLLRIEELLAQNPKGSGVALMV